MTESSFRSRRNEMAWLTDDASLLRPPRSAITPSGWTRLKGCPGQEEDGREQRPHAIYSPAITFVVFFFFFLLDKEPFSPRGRMRPAPFWRSFKEDAIVSSRFCRVPKSIAFLQDLTTAVWDCRDLYYDAKTIAKTNLKFLRLYFHCYVYYDK